VWRRTACGCGPRPAPPRRGRRRLAAAGAASFRRRASLERCRTEAAAEVARLRAELEADPGTLSRRQAAARLRAAADRERRVEAALAVAAQFAAKRQATPRPCGQDPPMLEGDAAGEGAAKPPPEPRVSTTDAEARVMKMPDGGFRPAFNLGFASDPRSGMIAAVTLDNTGSDKGQLRPMSERLAAVYSERLAAVYGVRPGEHLADGGFAKLADIEALAAVGVAVFAPVPKPRDAARDPHAPRDGDGPGVAAWRQRMGSEAAKAVSKERAARSAPPPPNASTPSAATAACCASSCAASRRPERSGSGMRWRTT
jgi:hypothetical protein